MLNKSDKEIVLSPKELEKITGRNVILISAKENTGINLLKDEIEKMFGAGEIDFNDQLYITNARQKNEILNAYESILQVEKSIEADMPEDFYSIDLTDAYESLGYVIGEAVDDDLVNEIFSKFCMGK